MEPSERLAAAASRLVDAYQNEIAEREGRWTAESPIANAISASGPEVSHAVAESGRVAVLTFNSALDHVRAMGRLLASRDVILSVATVTRGALEAAAMTHYLLEPGIPPREQARRYLNERLETLTETRLLAERAGQTKDAAHKRELVDEVLAIAGRLGFEVRLPSKDWQAPRIGRRPGATDKVQDLLGHGDLGKMLYKVLSATAHAAPFGIAQYLLVLDEPGPDGYPDIVSTTIGITAKDEAIRYGGAPVGLVAAGERLFRAFGWDHGRMSAPVQLSLSAWMDAGGLARRNFRDSVDFALGSQSVPEAFRKKGGSPRSRPALPGRAANREV